MNERCSAYRRALLLALPTALDDKHPSECEPCLRLRDEQCATTAFIRKHRPAWRAPIELRERVAAALDQERAGTSPRTTWAQRLAVGVVAIVVAASVIFVVLKSRHEPSGATQARHVVDLLVADHLKFARVGPERLKIASASPADIQVYFEEGMGLSPQIPNLDGSLLLGGRRCSLGGIPAALVFYEQARADKPAESISLFVFELGRADFALVGEAGHIGGRRVVEVNQRGVGLLLWEDKGLAYALAGTVDTSELRRMVAGAP